MAHVVARRVLRTQFTRAHGYPFTARQHSAPLGAALPARTRSSTSRLLACLDEPAIAAAVYLRCAAGTSKVPRVPPMYPVLLRRPLMEDLRVPSRQQQRGEAALDLP
eukprot:3386482-Pleurochrysis_carterae.AAC.5